MVAYLCIILCLVIGIQANIQNFNEVSVNWKLYAHKKLKNILELILSWTKRPHIGNNSINITQTLNTIGSKTK
jgi:hypothetical protein